MDTYEDKLCMRKIGFSTVFGVKNGDEIKAKEIIGHFSKPVLFTDDTIVYDAELSVIRDGFSFFNSVKDVVSSFTMGVFGKKVRVNDFFFGRQERW